VFCVRDAMVVLAVVHGATKPGNLECSGNSPNLENLAQEFSGNCVQPRGKFTTNKILSPDVVSMVQKCSRISLRPGLPALNPAVGAYSAPLDYHYYNYFFVAITLKFMALEKPGKLPEYFLLHVHPVGVI